MTFKRMYQLWCYYETAGLWQMEGFYATSKEAEDRLKELRDDGMTPCMPDWAVVQVDAKL